MNCLQDSGSHSPADATKQRNFEQSKEYFKKKQSWTQEYKEDNKKQWGYQKQWKDCDKSTWDDYGDYGSQSDSSHGIRSTTFGQTVFLKLDIVSHPSRMYISCT